MKKNSTPFWICGLIFAAAAGFFASSALLCHEPPPPPEYSEPSRPDQDFSGKKDLGIKHQIDSALGLSARQIALLDSNGHACDSIRKEMKKAIHEKERRLHDILDADSVNAADLQVVRMELLILNEKRLDSRIADIQFFKSVLTPAQRIKLKEMPRNQDKPKHFPKKQ